MRPYTTLFAASVLMVGSALAMPDGTGGHHHHTDHAAVSAPSFSVQRQLRSCSGRRTRECEYYNTS